MYESEISMRGGNGPGKKTVLMALDLYVCAPDDFKDDADIDRRNRFV